ncbi:hypothetical protein R3P38DRAFT_3068806, partial [Favolaschia claudopus]
MGRSVHKIPPKWDFARKITFLVAWALWCASSTPYVQFLLDFLIGVVFNRILALKCRFVAQGIKCFHRIPNPYGKIQTHSLNVSRLLLTTLGVVENLRPVTPRQDLCRNV